MSVFQQLAQEPHIHAVLVDSVVVSCFLNGGTVINNTKVLELLYLFQFLLVGCDMQNSGTFETTIISDFASFSFRPLIFKAVYHSLIVLQLFRRTSDEPYIVSISQSFKMVSFCRCHSCLL